MILLIEGVSVRKYVGKRVFLTLVSKLNFFFFDINKRYPFIIQIDRVYRHNMNSRSLKTKKVNLLTNLQHSC